MTRALTQTQYETYAAWFANARRLRALTSELEALSLVEMARAEGRAKITLRTPAPPRTRPVRGQNLPKHLNRSKRREIGPLNAGPAPE